MKYLILLLQALEIIWMLIAWAVVPFALLFARKVDDPIKHNEPQENNIQRYKLPRGLSWMETPDELLAGGMYEPLVYSIYKKYGWFICAWYWIGVRNIGHGIMWSKGVEVGGRLATISAAERQKKGIYRKEKAFLIFKIITGFKVVHDVYSTKTKSGYWAVPVFSIRLKNQD